MTRFFLASALLIGISGQAIAADAVIYEPPTDPVPVSASYNWSGAYVGVHAGYLMGNVDHGPEIFFDGPSLRTAGTGDLDGFVGGIYVGFNHQINNLVFGVEGDVGFGDMNADSLDPGFNRWTSYDLDWNAHLRGRIGFAMDRTLFYAAGGLAVARLTDDDTDPGYGEYSDTAYGWTIGAGIEHAFTDNVLLRAEYLYDDYGGTSGTISGNSPDQNYVASDDLTAHTLRVGVAYKF